MLFNTAEYLVFFLAAVCGSWLFGPRFNIRLIFLTAASFYFYASNNGWQLLILLFTTTVDYFIAIAIENTANPVKRKRLLIASLVSNLSVLGYFKYCNFFIDNLTSLAKSLGYSPSWVDVNVILPVGISFFTFEALSYTIDVYRGKIKAERSWFRVAFLISFFPHLIAGPIVRAADFFPQTHKRRWLTKKGIDEGLLKIFKGLFKKIIIADYMATFANQAFGGDPSVDTLRMWIGVYAFSAQIFFDFSGYTDIALGSARLLGFRLPENFNNPYFAESITDFWRRWHITLSRWLRDYLYISLGGNRGKSPWLTYRNLMLTMLLGGLWHGAAWHFILWGGAHGALLVVERLMGVFRPLGRPLPQNTMVKMARGFLVFNLVTFLWIPFRCGDLSAVARTLEVMLRFDHPSFVTFGELAAVIILAATWFWQALSVMKRASLRIGRAPVLIKGLAYAAIWMAVVIFNSATPQNFIYFQF